MAIDSAWQMQGMQKAQLTVFSNVTRIPSTSPGGGLPGGGTGNRIFSGGLGDGSPTEIGARLRSPELDGAGDVPPSHATNLQIGVHDVLRTYSAGGSGLGDPLFREPWRVAEDLDNGMITADVVPAIYGVVLRDDGSPDEEATAAKRRELRAQRLGAEPSRDPEPMDTYRAPLLVDGAEFHCGHCDAALGPTSGNWKDGAAHRSWPLTERAGELGTKVRPTKHVAMTMWEHYCPDCGSLLEAEICEEGEQPAHDIRLGDTRDEPGEPF
jgi:N-methylhydantoinase B